MDYIIYFLIAIMSGMGVGSAGLLIIYLTSFGNVEQFSAQGLNLVFFLFATIASLLVHVKKRKLYPYLIAGAVILAIPGVLFGGYIARMLETEILRKLFGGMLVITGSISASNVINEMRSGKNTFDRARK